MTFTIYRLRLWLESHQVYTPKVRRLNPGWTVRVLNQAQQPIDGLLMFVWDLLLQFCPWNHHGIEWWQYPRNEDFMNLVYNAMSYLQCNDTTVWTTLCDLPCLPWTLQDTFWNYISREDLPQGFYPWLSLIALSEFISWSSTTSTQKNLLFHFFELWTLSIFVKHVNLFVSHIFFCLTKTKNRNPCHRTRCAFDVANPFNPLNLQQVLTAWRFNTVRMPSVWLCWSHGGQVMIFWKNLMFIGKPSFFLWGVRLWIC